MDVFFFVLAIFVDRYCGTIPLCVIQSWLFFFLRTGSRTLSLSSQSGRTEKALHFLRAQAAFHSWPPRVTTLERPFFFIDLRMPPSLRSGDFLVEERLGRVFLPFARTLFGWFLSQAEYLVFPNFEETTFLSPFRKILAISLLVLTAGSSFPTFLLLERQKDVL